MKPITREWISKAEGDWAAANLLFRARRNTNYDATCFHAQQCAEKHLKARLEEAGVASGKTHDLAKAAVTRSADRAFMERSPTGFDRVD